jgi:hypothetical protein
VDGKAVHAKMLGNCQGRGRFHVHGLPPFGKPLLNFPFPFGKQSRRGEHPGQMDRNAAVGGHGYQANRIERWPNNRPILLVVSVAAKLGASFAG